MSTSTTLITLPVEIIAKVLAFLRLQDLIVCQLVCQQLNSVVTETALLQYLKALEIAGVSDDLDPGLSISERMHSLQQREQAWSDLQIRRTFHIPVPFEPTGIYDLTGGALLLGTADPANHRPTSGYSYITLPSLGEGADAMQERRWVHNELGMHVVDIGLAVHEHDLIALLTTKLDGEVAVNWASILELRLTSFSTGRPHPQATVPVIEIARKSPLLGNCSVLLNIVGDRLALLVTYPWARGEMEDMFFLVNWKTGSAHRLRVSDWGMYTHFAFLSEDTLVFPNSHARTLEICKLDIPSDDADDLPVLRTVAALALPTMTAHSLVTRVDCRVEPGPPGRASTPSKPPAHRPYRDSPADAILIFNYLVQDARRPLFGDLHAFSFIVHCRALLDHVPTDHPTAPETLDSEETWHDESSTDDEWEDVPDGGAAFEVVPWEKWGPQSTRWFEYEFPEALRWTTTSAGQRSVAKERAGASPLIVRDFNPHSIRQLQARIGAGAGSTRLPNGNTVRVVALPSSISCEDVFEHPFSSALPYCETVTAESYAYDGVLMDEERVLGLRVGDDEVGISSFEVHILG